MSKNKSPTGYIILWSLAIATFIGLIMVAVNVGELNDKTDLFNKKGEYEYRHLEFDKYDVEIIEEGVIDYICDDNMLVSSHKEGYLFLATLAYHDKGECFVKIKRK